MTPNEFKAWFDGFTEAFTGCPTKVQWTRIKARVAEIDGKPVTERVYVDRYYPTYIKTFPGVYPNWYTTYCGAATGIGSLASGQSQISNNTAAIPATFNSSYAMLELGRAEGKSFS